MIVVAEGCGDTIISSSAGKDAGGNKVLADVGAEPQDITADGTKTTHDAKVEDCLLPCFFGRFVLPSKRCVDAFEGLKT